jgi:transposase-like protein
MHFFLGLTLEKEVPLIKGRIHTDEKIIHVGKELMYDINSIDAKTKYVLAHTFMKNRTKQKCREHFKKIKVTCQAQIMSVYEIEKQKLVHRRKLITFVCDGFENYKNATSYHFRRLTKIVSGVPIACRKHGLKHNNNPIERYNQDIKDRIKIMRHFGSENGARYFLDLKPVIKNFVNPHQQLSGRTPAEVAKIHLELGRQKLTDLIMLQAKKTHHSLR